MTIPQPSYSDSNFNADDSGEGCTAPQVTVLQQRRSAPSSGTDSSASLIVGQSISTTHEDSASSNSDVQIGTPLVVGSFKAPRLSQIATPFPSLTRQHQPSKLSTSFIFSSPLMPSRQRSLVETRDMGASSDDDEDSEREEARLLLNAMRAQHQVHQMEQSIVNAQLAENAALSELYKFRASRAQKKLDTTEYDLGCLRNAIRKNGISVADLPSMRKWRRKSSDASKSIASTSQLEIP